MQRWMDDQDTFQGTQPGYWYDDGQPEPTYGTQADVEAAIEAVRQQEASQPAPSAPAAQRASTPRAKMIHTRETQTHKLVGSIEKVRVSTRV